MIIANEKERSVTVILENTEVEDIVSYQKAIITLIQFYRFSEFGDIAGDIIYDAITLLNALTPNLEQQQNGLLPQTVINEKTEC